MTPVALVHTSERSSLARLAPVDAQAKLIDMWLYGKAKLSQDSYRRYITRFLAFVAKPLAKVTLEDLYDFARYLDEQHLAPNTQKVMLSAVKSLLSFAYKVGMTPVNVGALLSLSKTADTITERILSEADVVVMIRLEQDKRNRLMLKLLYLAGLRVSELCALKWKDLTPRGDSGQVTVLAGKGSKTRSILLPKSLWDELIAYRKDAPGETPVFPSCKGGGHLHRQNVNPIIKAAAARAGVTSKTSPHWLRHSHATHSLERGANIGLVKETMGHANVATTSRYLHARPNDSSAMYLSL